MLEVGDKVHVVARRRFEQDMRRHFVGTVTALSSSAFRVEGYAFVYNPATNEYERRPDLRTRLVPLADASMIINIMPREVDPAAIHYTVLNRHLVATDGAAYTLDINEFGVLA